MSNLPKPKKGVYLGGRKKGTKNKKVAERLLRAENAVEIARQKGLLPIEVMLDNMIHWHGKAGEILQRLLDLEVKPPSGFNEIKEMNEFRRGAQDAAREAAPYVHPKLAPINGETGETEKMTVQFIIES